MNTLLMMVLLIASCVARPAFASVTAALTLTETGTRIEARVGLAGIADCPTSGSVTIEWTSPDKLFVNSTYEAHWRSCAMDTGEARTWAYRTLTYTDPAGKKHRAAGVWKVRVLAGDVVLATGSYEVK
jgi:hypothetical protein